MKSSRSPQPDRRRQDAPPPPLPDLEPPDLAILHELLAGPTPRTLAALARQSGQSPAQVTVRLDTLARHGCDIRPQPTGGLLLTQAGLACWRDYLLWSLRRSQRPPRIIQVFARTSSTQDALRRLIDSAGPLATGHRALVIADEQTHGRGRLGRRWVASPGSALTFSLALTAPRGGALPSLDRLTLATSVSVARALDQVLPPALRCAVKWPNDVLLERRKIAGILVESHSDSRGQAALVGVGVNIADQSPASAEVREQLRHAACLHAHAPGVDRLRVLDLLLHALDHALEHESGDTLLAEWRRRSDILGRTLTIHCGGQAIRGQVLDLDPALGLIVRSTTGTLLHLPAATSSLRHDDGAGGTAESHA